MRLDGYQPSDDGALDRLLAGAADERRPAWRWKFLDHPDRPKLPYLSVAREGEGAVAAQGARPIRLIRDGQFERSAQVLESSVGPLEEEGELKLARALLDRLVADDVSLAYAVPTSLRTAKVLGGLGFQHSFDVVVRNLYLGLGSVSSRLDEAALTPFRKLAKFARRLRLKLIEVDFDETWLAYAARLFAQRRPDLAFAVERSQDYLRWRYKAHPEHQYRLLVLRRNAGVGIDAFVVLRMIEARPGRMYIELVDHWTRIGERRWTAWLLGELALWSMAENADVIQAFAAAGSLLDQVLIGVGCIRKKASLPFMVKELAPPEEQEAHPVVASSVQLRASDLDLF
jgi:hypothetical protein